MRIETITKIVLMVISMCVSIAIIVMLITLVVSKYACAAEIGATVAGDYYLNNETPAGWYRPFGADREYKLETTLHFTQGNVIVAINPYMIGNASPDFVGMYVGVGYKLPSITFSMFHHSCHNMDYAAYFYNADKNEWLEPPPCNYNGLRMRYDIGTITRPLW